jgi:aspartyl-tRNA synthetase
VSGLSEPKRSIASAYVIRGNGPLTSILDNNGEIKAIVAKDAANKYTRKDMDALTEFVNIYGAKGLAWVKVVDDGLSGPIARFFEDVNVETLPLNFEQQH